jgi:hypothetical protein
MMIPARNASETIKAAIDSALQQTECTFEIIVIEMSQQTIRPKRAEPARTWIWRLMQREGTIASTLLGFVCPRLQ